MNEKPQFRDEIDFRELLRSPEKLFGYSYIYVIAMVVALGLVYLANLTDMGKNAITPEVISDSSAFVTDIPLQAPVVLPPVDVFAMAVRTDSLLARGRQLFRANCSSCHGENGQGDGPAGAVMNPKPRNFHATEGWTNGARISQIYRTLQEGLVRNGMAAYNYLPPADRFALIHVVRSFQASPPVDTREELQQLETSYQLSKGTSVSGQIPVRRATDLVIAEGASAVHRIREALHSTTQQTGEGAEIFRRVSAEPERTLTALANVSRPLTLDEFIRMSCADPVSVGFRSSVVHLADSEWGVLYAYLKRMEGPEEGGNTR